VNASSDVRVCSRPPMYQRAVVGRPRTRSRHRTAARRPARGSGGVHAGPLSPKQRLGHERRGLAVLHAVFLTVLEQLHLVAAAAGGEPVVISPVRRSDLVVLRLDGEADGRSAGRTPSRHAGRRSGRPARPGSSPPCTASCSRGCRPPRPCRVPSALDRVDVVERPVLPVS